MNNNTFRAIVKMHSLLPNNLLYNSNALCGEVGEIANVIKKIIIRKTLKPEDVTSMHSMEEYLLNLQEELGDALFYLFRIAEDINVTIDTVKHEQAKKLGAQDDKYKRTFLK